MELSKAENQQSATPPGTSASDSEQATSTGKPAPRLSSMQRKFISAAKSPTPFVWREEEPSEWSVLDFRPHYLFFYGALTDPAQLRKVLRLEDTPALEPASIVGWKIMFWGQHPALVFKQNHVTQGVAYWVTKEAHVEYLKAYATEAYRLRKCKTKMADGRDVYGGETFILNGDKEDLSEEVGSEFRPHYLFFYGTLTDPVEVRKVLRLEYTPTLELASISGWKIMFRGPYKALVREENNVVLGVAYEVTSERHVRYLQSYETKAYRAEKCDIKMADGRIVHGETFVYNGAKEDLFEEDLSDFRSHYLFFYGTLMDPAILCKVLRLEDSPNLEPASITGWKIMFWGPYKALVREQNKDNIIQGVVYEVTEKQHLQYLQAYETKAYRIEKCAITMADGNIVQGATFVYDGDEKLLKEERRRVEHA